MGSTKPKAKKDEKNPKKEWMLPCLLVLCNVPLAILFFFYWFKNPDVHTRTPSVTCIQSALKNEAITGIPGVCP